MCKHCKPTEATPAAEAGNLTDQLALFLRDLVMPLNVHDGEALRNQTADYIDGLEVSWSMINRAEKLLATYHESLITYPEPPEEEPEFRYYSNCGTFFWKMPTAGGKGECRRRGTQDWNESVCDMQDMFDEGVHEIPNPDQQP